MSKDVNFVYKLEGNIDNLEINDVTNILCSISNIIQEANKIINKSGKPIGISIKPFEKGSFIFNICLFAQNNFQQLINFLDTKPAEEIKNLLEWLGLIASGIGTTCVGLIKLIKWLKGSPIKNAEKTEENFVKITNNNNDMVNISIQVFNLYNNNVIKNNIYNMIGLPLENENIEKIEGYIKGQEESTKSIIEKDVIPYLKQYATENTSLEDDGQSFLERIYISPKRGSFAGEKNSWSFTKCSDNSLIKIDVISDQEFLTNLKNGNIRPYEKDILCVEIKTTLNKETKKAARREIIKLIEYKPYSEKQIDLFD